MDGHSGQVITALPLVHEYYAGEILDLPTDVKDLLREVFHVLIGCVGQKATASMRPSSP